MSVKIVVMAFFSTIINANILSDNEAMQYETEMVLAINANQLQNACDMAVELFEYYDAHQDELNRERYVSYMYYLNDQIAFQYTATAEIETRIEQGDHNALHENTTLTTVRQEELAEIAADAEIIHQQTQIDNFQQLQLAIDMNDQTLIVEQLTFLLMGANTDDSAFEQGLRLIARIQNARHNAAVVRLIERTLQLIQPNVNWILQREIGNYLLQLERFIRQEMANIDIFNNQQNRQLIVELWNNGALRSEVGFHMRTLEATARMNGNIQQLRIICAFWNDVGLRQEFNRLTEIIEETAAENQRIRQQNIATQRRAVRITVSSTL